MNNYEHTLIMKQDLQESKVKTFINKYIDIINNNSGKVIKTENWGLKNFSHKILNLDLINNFVKIIMGPKGFDPLTIGLEVQHSIQAEL